MVELNSDFILCGEVLVKTMTTEDNSETLFLDLDVISFSIWEANATGCPFWGEVAPSPFSYHRIAKSIQFEDYSSSARNDSLLTAFLYQTQLLAEVTKGSLLLLFSGHAVVAIHLLGKA